jgi:anti-sigma regulatory factor (Ser/Thr protein kinase)
VIGFCHSRGLDNLADDAVIIISELVANVVAHARTAMTVAITVAGPYLHLVVRDGSARRPRLRAQGPAADGDEGGRGLYLVQRLATGWGWRFGYNGKAVWATMRTSRPAVR